MRIFPKATVHVKKATLARTLTLQILFQGKEYTSTITILYKRTLPQTVYFLLESRKYNHRHPFLSLMNRKD